MKTENNRLREALEKCANWGEQIDCQLGSSDETVYAFRDERSLAHNISECARAAIAEPVKNCEVGTPEEQCRRWRSFCDTIDECEKCPCQKSSDEISADCFARWAQMTYDKESAGE